MQVKVQEMYKNIINHVRRYPFSVACVVLVWLLSLTPFFPETPFDNVQFIDKWTHLVMYGGTTFVIWWEYSRHHQGQQPCWRLLVVWGFLAPILMGGLLELLQAYATTTRNGDWLDFVANTVGVVIGAIIGRLAMVLKSNLR